MQCCESRKELIVIAESATATYGFAKMKYDAARYGWLDREHWSIWHEWLTSVRGASNLRSDLMACDPKENGFPSIRACLAQLEDEKQPHSIEFCASLKNSR